MRGPKRATKIRKLFNLSKDDDVRKYVNTYRRTFVSSTGNALLIFLSLVIVSRALCMNNQIVHRCSAVTVSFQTWQGKRGARLPRSRGL